MTLASLVPSSTHSSVSTFLIPFATLREQLLVYEPAVAVLERAVKVLAKQEFVKKPHFRRPQIPLLK